MVLPAQHSAPVRAWLIVLAPPVAFLSLYGVYAPNQPLLSPDSAGYLEFSSLRGGGYPFFLALLKPVVRDIGDIALAQRVIYALAVSVLSCGLWRYAGRAWPAALASVALLCNPEVNRYHFAILTESLFLSVSALFVAAALAQRRTGSLRALATAAALAGVLIAIRPTGWAFVPALAILIFMPSRPVGRLWRRLLTAVVPILAVLALESAYYAAHHAGPRASFAPLHLFAKAGMIDGRADAAAPSPEMRALRDALEDGLAPVRRLIADAPNLAARCTLGASYETFVQYRFAVAGTKAVAGDGTAALVRVSLDRLAANPLGTLGLGLRNLYCLWTLGAMDRSEWAAMNAYLESRRPLPFETAIQGIEASRRLPFASALRLAMLAVAALLAVAAGALVLMMLRGRSASRWLVAGGLCAVITHAALLLTAAGGVGIPRYLLGLWVPLALGCGLSAFWLVEARFRPLRPPTEP